MKDNREVFYFKAKISFSALKKKLTVNFFQQCTQLKLALVPGSVRNLGKSYRAIFEKTPYMYRFVVEIQLLPEGEVATTTKVEVVTVRLAVILVEMKAMEEVAVSRSNPLLG